MVPDCKRAKMFLAEHRIPYESINIDEDPDGLAYVEEFQNGGRSIPTILFADGSHLVEPGNDELADKLGIDRTPEGHMYDLVSSAVARPAWPPRSMRPERASPRSSWTRPASAARRA